MRSGGGGGLVQPQVDSGHDVLARAATTGVRPSCSILHILARRTRTVPSATMTLPEALHLYVRL